MEKALLCSYDYYKKKDGSERMSVQFNPETYVISGGNGFEVKDQAFNNAYRGFQFSFIGRKPSTLTADLFFDSYRYGLEEQKQSDVREKFKLLRKFLVVQPDRHEPFVMKFAWGTLSFIGVITQISESYTMFSDAGVPVRAKIKLTMTGCREQDLSGQANESPDRTKRYTPIQGETLWDIADREYGSPEQWRVIADANGIEDPLVLAPGRELSLPPLD